MATITKTETIVSGPAYIFTAPEGTNAPAFSANVTPGSVSGSGVYTPDRIGSALTGWEKLGRDFQDDAGVEVTLSETYEETNIQNSTMPVKSHRTAEMKQFKMNLQDFSLETFDKVFNYKRQFIAKPSGRAVSLFKGFEATVIALLIRGVAPFDNSLNLQIWVPKIYVSELGAFALKKGTTMVPVTLKVLDDTSRSDDERAGQIQEQTSGTAGTNHA